MSVRQILDDRGFIFEPGKVNTKVNDQPQGKLATVKDSKTDVLSFSPSIQ